MRGGGGTRRGLGGTAQTLTPTLTLTLILTLTGLGGVA